MDEQAANERLRRFLSPQFAIKGETAHGLVGHADTPAADALCELHIRVDEGRIVDMCFAVYGPPIAVACADWLCDHATGRTTVSVRDLSVQTMQTALALAPGERFAALLALDALDNAMLQMES